VILLFGSFSKAERMSWEIDTRIANGIAVLGSVTAIIMWLAPVRDVWTAKYSVFRMKNTENVATPFGFVAGMFNCILWNMYASTRLDTMTVPFIVNSAGFLLNFANTVCYYYYGNKIDRRDTRRQLLLMFVTTALAIGGWIIEKDNEVVGYFAAFVNVLMLFGPLAAANQVIKQRSSKGMSLMPMIMTLLSATVWIIYNVYIKVVPGIIPNALGVLFGILQLVLYGWAKRQDRKLVDTRGGIADEVPFEPVDIDRRPVSGSVRQRTSSLGLHNIVAEGP